jgi:hypothetical protein
VILLISPAARADDYGSYVPEEPQSPAVHDPQVTPPPKFRRRDPLLHGIGIATTSLGATAVVAGACMIIVDTSNEIFTTMTLRDTGTESSYAMAGGLTMVLGIAATGAGIVMMVVGGKKIPLQTAANGVLLAF